MSLPHTSASLAPRATWLADGHRVDSPLDLALAEQQLVLEGVFRFEPLTRTANEYDFTLKQMLSILSSLLHLDLAAFVDFAQETVFGVAQEGCAAILGEELTEEAAHLFEQRGEFGRRLRNTVLWNRRLMQNVEATGGEWLAIRSHNSELVDGCYLFHFASGQHHSPAALAALCATAEQCLVMPQLILKNEQLHQDMQQRYRAVSEMTSLFRAVDDPDFGLQYLLILLDYTQVDRGIFWELDPNGDLRKTVQIGLSPELAGRFSIDGEQLFWEQMARDGNVVWIEEPLLLAGLPAPGEVSVDALATQVCHSFLGFPLRSNDTLVGVVGLLDADYTRAGGEHFIQVISEIGASYIDNSQRHRHLLEAKELESQVRVAAEIQQGLLLNDLPEVENFELIARNFAAKELGGDFYFVTDVRGHLHAAIGDVSGKGVPAGLIMAGSRCLLQTGKRLSLSNRQVLGLLNDVLTDVTPSDKFVTMYYLDLDPRTGELECWNAGHDPLYIWRAATGELEVIQADGMILGVLDEQPYLSETVHLQPGDVALLFTDGLPEGMNAQREQFGFARIEHVLKTYGHCPAEELWDVLLTEHANFTAGQPQHDDLTLILLRAKPEATFTQE